jgi:hypothetical protein
MAVVAVAAAMVIVALAGMTAAKAAATMMAEAFE